MNYKKLLFCLLSLASSAFAEIKIETINVAKSGSDTIFAIALHLPGDIQQTVSLNSWGYHRSPIVTLPTLLCENSADCSIYIELTTDTASLYNYNFPEVLNFIGKTQKTGNQKLKLRYLKSDGSRGTDEVALDFSKAGALNSQAWPEPTATPSWMGTDPQRAAKPQKVPQKKENQTPLQRWATAQANCFRILEQAEGNDIGGFLTFATLQTKRKYNLPQDAVVPFPTPFPGAQGEQLTDESRMYDTVSGALALQESLQLDRMLNTAPHLSQRTVDISSIAGVAVKSHPFDEMRKGKEPKFRAIEALVPHDNYSLSFANIAKMLELFDQLDEWGSSLLTMYEPQSADYSVRARLHEQLCLPDSLLTRVLGPTVVHEVALTGSDPFMREGSDVSLIFDVAAKDIFSAAVQEHFDAAKTRYQDAKYEKKVIEGVEVETLRNQSRTVSCSRAWLENRMVYSNSDTALKKIIQTMRGTVPSLSEAPDFKYMRAAVYPLDPQNEDGFLYLSDDFIRSLVGPALRIKEKRRLEAATSLKLLTNSVMLYGYEHRMQQKPTMQQLVNDKLLNLGDLYDPEGGKITWDENLNQALSTSYGAISSMTPLIELPIDKVTEEEKTQYTQFVARYEQYWRRYFDPIGIRIKVDKQIAFDVTILPLIDQSAYKDLKDWAGGETTPVDISKFSANTLLRAVFHINPKGEALKGFKDSFAPMFSPAEILPNPLGDSQARGQQPQHPDTRASAFDWIGDWLTFWLEDTPAFKKFLVDQDSRTDTQSAVMTAAASTAFDVPFVLGVNVKKPFALAAFLVGLRTLIQTSAPNMVAYNNLEPYKGITIVEVALKSNPFGMGGPEQPAHKEALYYATIGDGLYFSTQSTTLKNLVDKQANVEKPGSPVIASQKADAHALFFVSNSAAMQAHETLQYYLEQEARKASFRNLDQIWLLGRTGLVEGNLNPQTAMNFLGYVPTCPSGGTYSYDHLNEIAANSIYGDMFSETRRNAPTENSPIGKVLNSVETLISSLRLTEEGLTTHLEINRR
jgi:hypothetical protein